MQILSPEQIDALKAARKQIPVLEREIAKAERAGVDVAAQKEQLARLKEQAAALWQVYGRKK